MAEGQAVLPEAYMQQLKRRLPLYNIPLYVLNDVKYSLLNEKASIFTTLLAVSKNCKRVL